MLKDGWGPIPQVAGSWYQHPSVLLHDPVNTSHSKQNTLLGAGDMGVKVIQSQSLEVLWVLGKAGIKKIITDIIKATKRKSEDSVEMLN